MFLLLTITKNLKELFPKHGVGKSHDNEIEAVIGERDTVKQDDYKVSIVGEKERVEEETGACDRRRQSDEEKCH